MAPAHGRSAFEEHAHPFRRATGPSILRLVRSSSPRDAFNDSPEGLLPALWQIHESAVLLFELVPGQEKCLVPLIGEGPPQGVVIHAGHSRARQQRVPFFFCERL